MNRKDHWENIYSTKKLEEVSWYQEVPTTAINYLKALNISKEDAIIDIGGGDSFFIDYLVAHGYKNVSVLDISENALLRAKKRLGEVANQVNWIVADVVNFKSEVLYDFWFDRAAFHFLTAESDIESYCTNLNENVSSGAKVVIGTFSEIGPAKCSGIHVKQYSRQELQERFSSQFICLSCQHLDHNTPFDTIQNFTFCSFEKRD